LTDSPDLPDSPGLPGLQGPDSEFRSGLEVQIVAPLDDHGTCTRRAADRGANRRALAAAGDGSDHRTNRRADAGARGGFRRLALVLAHVGVLDVQRVAARCAHALDRAVEIGGPPVAEADAIEVEGHVRASGHAAGAVDTQQAAVDARAFEWPGRHD